MTLARVVGKGKVMAWGAAELDDVRVTAPHTLIDIGTGDGRFVRDFARRHAAEYLVIGIDALAEPMGASARKAPANALFVRASIEALPEELRGVADVVTVLLPWGRLLEGIVLADADVIAGIAAAAGPGARVEITLNGEIWQDSPPARYNELPLPTPEYVAEVVAPAFAAAGVALEPANWMSAVDAKALPTTWARRLGHGRAHPRFLRVEGVRR